jgi:hypothetical protein
MHPVHELLSDVAAGRFPPADGTIEVLPTPSPLGVEAVIELTGYAMILTSRDPEDVLAQPIDAFGGVIAPSFLQWLAGPQGWIGTHDALIVASGLGGGSLPIRRDAEDHQRVRLARARRTNVSVHGDDRGLVTIGEGIHGHVEIGVELETGVEPGNGVGRWLITEARRLAPAGTPVFAAVSPGNAASLRAFLAAGFVPVGAEILFQPHSPTA